MKPRYSDAVLVIGIAALIIAHWLLRGNTSWWTGLPFGLIPGICMAVARTEGRREGIRVGRHLESADRYLD